MQNLTLFAICCSALFACTSEPLGDGAPDSGAEPQQAAAQNAMHDEVAESIARPPEAADDETTTSIQQFEEGDDDTHWYTPIWPFPWPWGHGHGHKMDPEPDRRKNRHSCEDWCAWEHRQCDKECWQKNPNPKRGFWTRQRCFAACKSAEQPCRAKCQEEFPDRPILTMEPESCPTSSPSNR